MNKSEIEPTSKEIAFSIYALPADDMRLRLNRVSDSSVIGELWHMAYQKDRSDLKKVISARAKKLGIELIGE